MWAETASLALQQEPSCLTHWRSALTAPRFHPTGDRVLVWAQVCIHHTPGHTHTLQVKEPDTVFPLPAPIFLELISMCTA
jgi:hypothetical protein